MRDTFKNMRRIRLAKERLWRLVNREIGMPMGEDSDGAKELRADLFTLLCDEMGLPDDSFWGGYSPDERKDAYAQMEEMGL